MNKPEFSVLCPTYNHASYISQCIESVLSQSLSDWELLILDDGSTDGTGEMVKPYLKDQRIRYFFQENKGAGKLAENYNFLLKNAKGSFVTILEGDDYAEPDLLAAHHNAFAKNPDAILSFNRVRVDESGHIWEAPTLPKNQLQRDVYENRPVGNAFNKLFLRCYIPAQGTTVRKSILVKYGGFEKVEALATVDYPTWLKLAQKGGFVFIPKTLATWRRHGGQSTKQRIVPLTQLMLPVFEKVYDELPPEILNHVSVTKKFVVHHWSVQFTKILIRGGNYQLQSKHWKEGRKLYFQSFRRWPSLLLLWRMKALLGIIFSLLHIPWMHWYYFVPERILRLF